MNIQLSPLTQKGIPPAMPGKSIGKLSLSRKLMIPTLIIFFLSFVVFFLYSYLTTASDTRTKEIEDSQRAEEFFQTKIKNITDFSTGLAIQAASNPEIQFAFAARDRQALQHLTYESFQALEAQYQIRQYQYHLAPATSFLRLHSLNKFGDDLSTFRFTVLEVNTNKRPVAGLEVGRGGAGIRSVQPVFYQGKHIGSVEFGSNVDEALVNSLKEEHGNDWRIILTREAMSLATLEDLSSLKEGPTSDTLILASTVEGIYPDATVYAKVLNGERLITQIKEGNRTYSVTSLPFRDYSGKVIGIVDILIDRTAIVQTQNSRIALMSLGIIAALVVGALSLTTITNRSLQPLGKLTKAVESIEKGELGIKIDITSQDEIGELGRAFNSMTTQLQETLEGLEQRVAARTRDLEVVAELGTATATILESKQLLQEMVDLTKERFHLYHSHIYLLDEEGKNLVLTAGAGEPGRVMVAEGRSIPLDREQSLVARAARERKGVSVNDVTQAPDFLPNPLLPETRSELAVPMIVGGNVIGVFDIQSDQVGRFTDSDVNIQTTLAAQLATSIQNVRSFEQSRKQAELESMVNTIGQKIQQTTSIEETLQTAIRELGTAIGASRVKANLAPARQDGDSLVSRN